METILGIDLGTTNSAVSIVKDGRPVVLRVDARSATLPSVVGFSSDGELLVGEPARNQALVAPARTVKSIKRKMGQANTIKVGDQEYSPQEISAMILRTLKTLAEQQVGQSLSKAVITVPAYFTENQREATREAGELAGLEVVRIINEPTAATLTYQPRSTQNERLLVYDLGGGTFDVSIVQIEHGVIEVLASHGDTNLGGDDFDQLLLDHVCDVFQGEHDIDLRSIPVARSRMLQAVERAKQELSNEAVVAVAEEFIVEKEGKPLNLTIEINRVDYEAMIAPLLEKTIASVDAALADAQMTPADVDRVVLVGGSSRTPMVHRMLKDQLGHEPHLEVDPDLCVSMGAAVQGALIAGVDVGAVLVDITPHTLGIRCVGQVHGRVTDKCFSPLIPRNSALPATRSEIYGTAYDGQEVARIQVLQGENEDATFNESVGEFMLEGLNTEVGRGNQILIRFDLDLDGILTVTAIERGTGLEKQLRLENTITKFHVDSHEQAKAKLAGIFGGTDDSDCVLPGRTESLSNHAVADDNQHSDTLVVESQKLIAKAHQLLTKAASEDADEIQELLEGIAQATTRQDRETLQELTARLEDLLFYVEDA